MDENKDIGKKRNFPEKSMKNAELNPFFEGNHLYVFLYKKAEKLSSALYMVTNFIPKEETLRSLLREKSINTFSKIIHLQKMSLTQQEASRTRGSIENRHDSLRSILFGITEIISFLEISHFSGLISEMNFMILKREYVELGTLIKNRKDDIAREDVRLDRSFFEVPDLYKTYALRQGAAKTETIKDTAHQIKDTLKSPKTKKIQKTKSHTKTVDTRYNSRRNTILELLQNKPSITVKDTADAINGCSTKTLQRELLALVSKGILKKKGERRWSTYSLA